MDSSTRYVSHEFWFDYNKWGLIGAGVARDDFMDPDDPGAGGEFDGLVTRQGSRLQVMTAAESGYVRVEWRAIGNLDDPPGSEGVPSSTVVVPTPKNELRIYDCYGSTQGSLLTSSAESVVRIEVIRAHDPFTSAGVPWGAADEAYRVSVAPAEGRTRWITRNPTNAMLHGLAKYGPQMRLQRPTLWERPGWEDHDVDDLGPLAATEFRQIMRWISQALRDRGQLPRTLDPHLELVMRMWDGELLDPDLLSRAKAEVMSYLKSVQADKPTFEGVEGRTARAALCLVDPPTDDIEHRMSWVQDMLRPR